MSHLKCAAGKLQLGEGSCIRHLLCSNLYCSICIWIVSFSAWFPIFWAPLFLGLQWFLQPGLQVCHTLLSEQLVHFVDSLHNSKCPFSSEMSILFSFRTIWCNTSFFSQGRLVTRCYKGLCQCSNHSTRLDIQEKYPIYHTFNGPNWIAHIFSALCNMHWSKPNMHLVLVAKLSLAEVSCIITV